MADVVCGGARYTAHDVLQDAIAALLLVSWAEFCLSERPTGRGRKRPSMIVLTLMWKQQRSGHRGGSEHRHDEPDLYGALK